MYVNVIDAIFAELRSRQPARFYESIPSKLLGQVFGNPSTRIIKDTIDVNVKDGAMPLGDGFLPIQKVTITFDWCGLTNEGEEVKFDKKFKESGYLPTQPAENALDVKEGQDGPEGSV